MTDQWHGTESGMIDSAASSEMLAFCYWHQLWEGEGPG